MSYQVFARKYRPKTFNDVLGQDHVITTLRNAIDQDRLAHAYLFVGPRGTGKTSTARIMAKALNCPNGPSIDFDPEDSICQEIAEGRSLDVLEIDGASNNGVEQVRDLRENVRFAPSVCRFKIIYIDEVHMLSNAAFNALLKTLEEPPAHVKFIFATTEPHKILPTIISRCQRFDLRPIDTKTIADHLTYIAENEGVKLDEAAAWSIAKGADGGMRDAQSMLDQLVAFCGDHITEHNVLDVFGFTSRETIAFLTKSILTKDTTAALELLHEQADSGKDLGQLLNDVIGCFRALLVAKVNNKADSDGIPEKLWNELMEANKTLQTDRLLNLVEIFAQTEANMKWASNKRLHMEIGVIKSVQSLNDIRISDVITALAGAGQLETIPQPEAKTTTPTPTQQEEAAVTKEAAQPEAISTPEPVKEPEPELIKTPEPPQPEPVVEVTSEPEPTPTPETIPEPVITLDADDILASEPVVTSKADDITAGFDKFIESAPEESEAPTPPTAMNAAPAQAKKVAPKAEEPKVEEPVVIKPEDDFNNDPLIKQAMETFQASRIQ